MKKRLIASVVIVLATLLSIVFKFIPYVGEYIFDLFALFIVYVSSMEICNLMNNKTNRFMVVLYAVVNYAIAIICLEIVPGINFSLAVCFQILALPIYLLIVFVVECIKNKKETTQTKWTTALNTLICCIYPAFITMLIVNINHIDKFIGIPNISVALLVLTFLIPMLTDTLAYLVGSLIKGPKLAPTISPKKTISGAIGGLVGGVIASMIVFAIMKNVADWNSFLEIYNLQWWAFLILGVVGSILGQCGDLFESKIKRNAGVKDSGNLIPGHGGMLDRVDALIFVIAFIYLFLIIALF